MPRILVVDDEEPLLELVSAMLKGDGYDVLIANSGQKALETLEQESIDLVLLDVMMPEMDGWDVVKEMKNRPTLRDVPIAMLTVKTMSPQYFYSDEVEGLVDYINKPFSKRELTERVKTIFEEVGRIESVQKGLKATNPEFMKEYEEISKTERLYENLMGGLEFSLSNMKAGSHDYKLVKDALDYGKVLLEGIKEKKEAYEKLIEK
jgi:CheY-like chemotaxis protein